MALKELRVAAGLRQEDVAKKLNIGQAAVSLWEAKKTRPSRKYLKPLARLYRVSLETLLKEVEE